MGREIALRGALSKGWRVAIACSIRTFGSGDPMTAWKRRLWRLEAWLAAALRRPRGVVAALALFALAGFAVLVEVKYFQDVFKDNAEAFAWGRQFLGGYGRHPVLTGWIAGVWYSVFPASDWEIGRASWRERGYYWVGGKHSRIQLRRVF